MTTVCLVRHGITDWNQAGKLQGREDTELNDEGRLQARICANYFKNGHWDQMVSSPLIRARETAEIIKEQLQLPRVHIYPDFIERDYGLASGLTVQVRNQKYPDGNIPGIEERERLRTRTLAALHSLVEKFPDQKVIVVTHGGVINSILATLSNGAIGTGKTKLKNGCLTILHHNEKGWSLEAYNLVPENGGQ